MAARRLAEQEGGLRELHGEDFHPFVGRTQGAGYPGERAAGAEAGDKGVRGAPELPEYLRPRRMLVVVGVDWVGKLTRQEIPVILGGQLLDEVDPRAVAAGGESDDLATEVPDELDALAAGLFGDGDLHLVAAGRAQHRERHARVAGGAFEDDRVGPEQPALFRVRENGLRQTVLDRAGRIHELALCEDGRAALAEMQGHQFRVADHGIENRFATH